MENTYRIDTALDVVVTQNEKDTHFEIEIGLNEDDVFDILYLDDAEGYAQLEEDSPVYSKICDVLKVSEQVNPEKIEKLQLLVDDKIHDLSMRFYERDEMIRGVAKASIAAMFSFYFKIASRGLCISDDIHTFEIEASMRRMLNACFPNDKETIENYIHENLIDDLENYCNTGCINEYDTDEYNDELNKKYEEHLEYTKNYVTVRNVFEKVFHSYKLRENEYVARTSTGIEFRYSFNCIDDNLFVYCPKNVINSKKWYFGKHYTLKGDLDIDELVADIEKEILEHTREFTHTYTKAK